MKYFLFNNFRKLFLCLIFSQIIFSDNLYPKLINFNLKRIKNKIEKNIKDTVDKITGKNKDKKKLLNAIKIVDSGAVIGLDLNKEVFEKFLKKSSKFLSNNNLICKQTDFIENLDISFKQNKENARKILYDKILMIYNDQKSPLIKFAKDIDQQESEINTLLQDTNTLIEKKLEIKDTEILNNFDSTVKKLNIVKNNIDILLEITNKLLTDI
ncbi:hypothetical protein K9M16_00495 [Candidatus Babeliales bacterium]|nr:hypothetical protein [Candidatus Babeliales bacterium]